MPFRPLFFKLLIHGDRALAAGSAQGKLHDHNRDTHDCQKDEIHQNKQAAAVLPDHVGELPYIAKTNGTACAQ